MEGRHFFSKLLLFGEYTVLLGSDALALPFRGFSGHFAWGSSQVDAADGLAVLFEHVSVHPELSALIDLQSWETDLQKGLYFASTIPAGYGLGSSGALVAACYERYAKEKSGDLDALKRWLAGMENAFHGASSGMDPLVSYTGQALLFKAGGEITPIPHWQAPQSLYLLDTSLARSTSQYVALFKSKMASDPSFRAALEELKMLNQAAISSLNYEESGMIENLFTQISALQLTCFRDFIPESIQPLWEKGLREKSYYMKLCGAGGGGMMLVLAPQNGIEKITGENRKILKF
jgi:mevalonate kinase